MQRRIDMLTRFEGDNPLAALAEIRYDRELGLMADEMLIIAYQAILGDQFGLRLAWALVLRAHIAS